MNKKVRKENSIYLGKIKTYIDRCMSNEIEADELMNLEIIYLLKRLRDILKEGE